MLLVLSIRWFQYSSVTVTVLLGVLDSFNFVITFKGNVTPFKLSVYNMICNVLHKIITVVCECQVRGLL